MYTHVLVPLDGSERAERALAVAAHIARASGAKITLLQALTAMAPIGSPYESAMASASMLEVQRAAAGDYLKRIVASPLLSGITVETVVTSETPAAAILDKAQDAHVDLIVMCSHGRSVPTRWMLGSISEHVARHAVAPVLVLREGGPVPAGPHPDPAQLTRIMVPLDGSLLAEAALTPAAELILALAGSSAALHLTVALTPLETDPQYMPEGLALVGARTYLARIADRLRATYPSLIVSWSVASGFDTAEALLRTAEIGDDVEGAGPPSRCDLIAMATHGRSGVARWALGSVTERVLHTTTLPILIVRPAVVAQAEQAPVARSVVASGPAVATS